MAQALRQSGQDSASSANDDLFDQGEATIRNLELEKHLKELDITIGEYKRRVTVQLKGNINGITSDDDLDRLLTAATGAILDELESLWDIQNGEFKGWNLQSGESIGKIKTFVVGVLDQK